MESDRSHTSILIFAHDQNKRFASSTTPSFTRARPSNIDLVNLHRANQAIAARPNHSNSQFMQQGPCCLISSQTQNSLNSSGISSFLLANHMPYCFKPQAQRNPAILKNRASGNRNLRIALSIAELPLLSHPEFPTATTADK